MQLIRYKITMYKNVIDSGWIDVNPLTVFVGKNESGKTSLLQALYKLNPQASENYDIGKEWPRSKRSERNENHHVCIAEFDLTKEELDRLLKNTGIKVPKRVRVSCDYNNLLTINVLDFDAPSVPLKSAVDALLKVVPPLPDEVSIDLKKTVINLTKEINKATREGNGTYLEELLQDFNLHWDPALSATSEQLKSQQVIFINNYVSAISHIVETLKSLKSTAEYIEDFIIDALPIFIYMSDYQTFTGTAKLDVVKAKKDADSLEASDKTLLMILELAGLNFEEEVKKGESTDREYRQYDMKDASEKLTKTIENRWRQRRYEVEFRADGQSFFTFVKDQTDPALLKLEERSQGFQWFFSFDLMFMHESKGTFKDCIILLDEPGLHLHPDAQKDLLNRLEDYAKDNILIYSTHLPFMLDLRKPEQIRVLSETPNGTVVGTDLTTTQLEAKLVLQAALGMSGSNSYLVAQRNLVVEGVDDFWIITEMSNILERSGEVGLPTDVLITPAGGASEVVYISTFMIGQNLDVVALLDSDKAGDDAAEKLIKNWLTKYQNKKSTVLRLAEVVEVGNQEYSIEDLFLEDFYLERVKKAYSRELTRANITTIKLTGKDQLCKKVERFFDKHQIIFNKGTVAKLIRSDLIKIRHINELPEPMQITIRKMISSITASFPPEM